MGSNPIPGASAFDGYLKKRWQFFPEEEEAFKEQHPGLHGQIQTL
jgi:hypothetical protein